MNENKPNIQEMVDKAKNGQLTDLMSKLSAQDAEKLNNILKDKDMTAKLLATPQAQQLLKLFKKGE